MDATRAATAATAMFAFSMVASLEEAGAGAGAAAAGASVAAEEPASGAGVTTVGASAVSEEASKVAPAAVAATVRPVVKAVMKLLLADVSIRAAAAVAASAVANVMV